MQGNNIHTSKIVEGYKKAFIDANAESDPDYCPKLITNSYGKKVLTVLEREMKNCNEMFMSVAFITRGGVTPLLGTFKELEARQIKARILTTDYLMFSDPDALDRLNALKNIEVKMFKTGDANKGFHTKGYMFHNKGNLRIIVGSSNLTQDAITKNYEWNTKIVSTQDGEFAQDIEKEFNDLWENYSVSYSDYRDEYIASYFAKENDRKTLAHLCSNLVSGYSKVLLPNKMQQYFVRNIESLFNSGENKALLISATGTGKTYASAFAIRQLLSKSETLTRKILFVSHREQINRQAKESYSRIFGSQMEMALLSGTNRDEAKLKDANFIFATIQTISKDNVLKEYFGPKDFSIIVLDECHRTGAGSYQKVIDYFKPDLLLGMSASPERLDGFDVFSLFDHNIALEIRLQQALENEMLCPFHYFGISEFQVDDESLDAENFKYLVSDERVIHIVRQAEYYGFSGNRVKGLIFCSRKEEAKELSRKFNSIHKYQTGEEYRTVVLGGDNSQEEREAAIERLVNDDAPDKLDYIFTVDIFNEGVDIPEINQVIMLRPTESPIIFVQQLGRGLRKMEGKEYVVVLDFIGNYSNNYMIPIALSGDRSGNKDNLRRGLMDGSNLIQGASTIYFDEISRNRIFKSIDAAQLNKIQILRREYQNLKFKLGRIPELKEFDEFGELDPLRIIDSCGSYHNFLSKYEKDYNAEYTEQQAGILEFVSSKFASGKRIHELSLLKILINSSSGFSSKWEKEMRTIYNLELGENERVCVKSVLTNKFFRDTAVSPCLLDEDSDEICPSAELLEAIGKKEFKSDLDKLIDFGIYRYLRDYAGLYKSTPFTLYKKYTYRDVCWLLNWEKEEVSLNIGGYKYDKYSNTYPIFINYEKDEDVGATTNYEDRFKDQSNIIAISKSKRTINSPDVQYAIRSTEKGIMMPLFVRKNKDDKVSKEFYFLGTLKHNGFLKEFIMSGTKGISAVEIGYHLDTPVESNLYEYLTERTL